jgi:hypothetical protein
MVNLTLEAEGRLSSLRHEDNGLFHVFPRFSSFIFRSERMDEPIEGRTGVETLRTRIGSICRERSVMQTENDCVELI